MHGALLKYNKIHNESLSKLALKLSGFQLAWGDLSAFGSKADLLSYDAVADYLSSLDQFDFIVVGDVFWETGQSICKYGKENNKTVFFLQHGQWIYVKNKKKLKYYPDHTMLFGDNVAEMCQSWEYGNYSDIHVVGSPRYDEASPNGGQYVYFSPPVIEEILHGKPSGRVRHSFLENLQALKGIDKEVQLVIQPHYREARTDYLYKLFPGAQFADPNLDAMKLVRGARKVLCSRNSTVALDAIAHQKPVVLMDLPGMDSCFFKRGYFEDFAMESMNRKEVISNLSKEANIPKDYCTVHAKKHIFLGDASRRIADLIVESV